VKQEPNNLLKGAVSRSGLRRFYRSELAVKACDLEKSRSKKRAKPVPSFYFKRRAGIIGWLALNWRDVGLMPLVALVSA
jgi:hypothetical protein